MDKYKKIEVIYPDGRRDCKKNVTETYRAAIEYIGLEKVRGLGIFYNSINIVSTRDEMENSKGKRLVNGKLSKGKKESRAISLLSKGSELGICTQFGTKTKYDRLVGINEALQAGLKIRLLKGADADTTVSVPIERITDDEKEGLLKEYNLTRYERSHIARRLCLEHYGAVCQICGFDFEKVYGKRDNDEPYIEIHHINPLAESSAEKGEHKVDYVNDLIPVCANCHRMLHHMKKRTLHPSELKAILTDRNFFEHPSPTV